MRYLVLRVENTLTKIGVCVALLIGSYIASGLVNASPVTKPALRGPRPRGVVQIAPSTPVNPEPRIMPDEPRPGGAGEIGKSGQLQSL